MLENTIHSIVGLARAEKALFTVTGISLGPFLHIDPISLCSTIFMRKIAACSGNIARARLSSWLEVTFSSASSHSLGFIYS